MEMEELTPHIQELKRVLGDKIDNEQLMRELDKYLNEYHVPIDQAKRGIIRKFGGSDASTFVTGNAIVKKIGDLSGSEQNVDVTAKVVFVDSKKITVKGLEKTIVSGILGDETGTVSFTIWEPGSVALNKGSVYNFRNCYCKTWNDKVQVNIGSRGRIEAAEGVNITLPERPIMEAAEYKIGDIKEGAGNVTVTGKIISVESKNIIARGEQKTVFSGLLADDTGKIQFSAWSDFSLKEGESVHIKNAYIRSWKGIPQLNMGDRCEVTRVEGLTNIIDTSSDSKKSIEEITRIGGGLDITLEGIIVDVRQGSGLIRRCPQCNRSILNGVCTAHGTVEGTLDLRLKVVIDDGTGAIGAIINRADTEKLIGVSLDTVKSLAAVQGEGAIGRDITAKVLMKRVMVTGNVMSDDYGPSMIVKKTDKVAVDVESEAEKLLDDVEAAI